MTALLARRGTIVNLRAIARVERDWRDQPVILLKNRPEKLSVSRTFAARFKIARKRHEARRSPSLRDWLGSARMRSEWPGRRVRYLQGP